MQTSRIPTNQKLVNCNLVNYSALPSAPPGADDGFGYEWGSCTFGSSPIAYRRLGQLIGLCFVFSAMRSTAPQLRSCIELFVGIVCPQHEQDEYLFTQDRSVQVNRFHYTAVNGCNCRWCARIGSMIYKTPIRNEACV